MTGASWLDYALLAEAACLLLVLVLVRRQRWLHPTTLFAGIWTLTLVVRLIAPLLQARMTTTAAAIIGIGLVAVCIPAIVGSRPLQAPDDVQLGDRGVALWRLIVLTCALGVAVAIGVYIFRAQVSAYVGADFEQLSATAVRRAQNTGARGGPLTLLMALAPLLGALGIYGGLRFSRWWYVVTALALVAVLQSPARTTTLGLVVTCATFYAYARPTIRRDPDAPRVAQRSSRALVIQFAAVAAAGLAYFVYTGRQLGKDAIAFASVTGWTWPEWLLSPVQYLVGGTAGLSAVTSSRLYGSPFEDTGQSVFLLFRLVGQQPETVAEFTPAPFPINVYTGFGNMYFDFGLAGVAVLSLVLGLFAQRGYRSYRLRLEFAWVAAVLVSLLVSTGIVYRLFALDVVALLLSGWLAFAWLRRSEHWQRRHTAASAPVIAPRAATGCGGSAAAAP